VAFVCGKGFVKIKFRFPEFEICFGNLYGQTNNKIQKIKYFSHNTRPIYLFNQNALPASLTAAAKRI
jgi:hypothetical protein